MKVRISLKNLYQGLYDSKIGGIPRTVLDYVKAGPVYHALSAAVIPTVIAWYSMTPQKTAENVVAVLGAAIPIAYLQYLGVQRYAKYERMKQALERSGYDERIVGGKDLAGLRWFCPRHAAGLAAKEAGYEKEFKETLETHGIKWYHLVPEPREWVRSAKKIGLGISA